ncbi:MAG TPA: tetratricopeptide repeat protein, partial [Phormidium sp.]
MIQQEESNTKSVEARFKLAYVWHRKGDLERAFIGYQEVLRFHPEYMPAYLQLGNLMLRQERIDEALDYYDKALSIDAEAADLSYYYAYQGLETQKNKHQPQENEYLHVKENP